MSNENTGMNDLNDETQLRAAVQKLLGSPREGCRWTVEAKACPCGQCPPLLTVTIHFSGEAKGFSASDASGVAVLGDLSTVKRPYVTARGLGSLYSVIKMMHGKKEADKSLADFKRQCVGTPEEHVMREWANGLDN